MNNNHFALRHTGPRPEEIQGMLQKIGVKTLDELISKTIPQDIRLKNNLEIGETYSEADYAKHIRKIASQNKLYRTYIGMGYYGTNMPAVIQRNILENPAWYTSYTPYQAEISQGRLEALLNFQTMVIELTKMEIANASLLDEGTAAAEAMIMLFNSRTKELVANQANTFLVDRNIFPQTIEVVKTRAQALNINIAIGDVSVADAQNVFGVLLQYPAGDGKI